MPRNKTALNTLRDARRRLAELGPDHTETESDEYVRRNNAVAAAEKDVRAGKRRGWQDVDMSRPWRPWSGGR